MTWIDRLRPHLPACGLLLLLGWIGYGQVVEFGLVNFDDDYFITKNPRVTEGLSLDNLLWAFRTQLMSIWHPVTWISYQIESHLFGPENHQARHAINLLIHLCSTLIVYHVGFRLFNGNRLAGFLIAGIFLLHPQHVQAVAWISERKGLLAGLFTMSAFAAHLHRKRCLTIGFFLLALMSKPSALPLICAIPIYDLLTAKGSWRTGLKQNGITYFCMTVPAILIAFFTVQSQEKQRIVLNWVHQNPGAFLLETEHFSGEILLGFTHYVKTFFIPFPLPLMVERPENISAWMWILCALTVCIFVALLIRFRRQRMFVFGMIWFVLFWLPVSGLLPFHEFYVADRYMYLPHVGLGISLGCLAQQWKSFGMYSQPRIKIIGLTLLMGIMLLMTRSQVKVWEDGVQLFEHERRVNPKSATALIYLGNAYFRIDQKEKGLEAFKQAALIGPNEFYPYAYLGFYYVEEKLLDEAQYNFEMALSFADPFRHHFIAKVYEHLVWIQFSNQNYFVAHQLIQEGLRLYPENEYLLGAQQQEL